MELYPAIDLRGGAAVRLVQGDFGRQQEFGDPVDLAERYEAAGARWVHVVDLDAARTGVAANRAVVLEIARRTGLAVQTGGGVRSAADAAELLGGGVRRVVLGTAAMSDPALVAELAARHPGAVAVGLDHRGGGRDVSVQGWEQASGTTLEEALERLEPVDVAALVVTSIERDGVPAGPDLEGLTFVLSHTRHPVLASGGVRSVDDLRTLAALTVGDRQVAGAVVGRALVDGSLDVAEAVRACATSA
ncbi:MAG TPA: 1-(5-phosphoribosyl)-5-[(5-phosphoribosylamino)methylideneamino] imidazole-4-carboxamide isomerase [Acidimicrobiales bacterium]|nr:1-(5-phosphoribosyl)-5-[(5-phosphoribosylamino)methylideneamino] imidazole-4-carboxamide isomerase [Acidimicrobiales bacterium]